MTTRLLTPARAMRASLLQMVAFVAAFALCLGLVLFASGAKAQTAILNVSYDPTRELYREINQAFVAEWRDKTGEAVTVRASHGGSGAQARAVIDGIDAAWLRWLSRRTSMPSRPRRRISRPTGNSGCPNNSSPYTSTIVFVVRKGNPKAITDWTDLAKPGVQVITPNPKTSGGARWNYLAAWGYALESTMAIRPRHRIS